MHNIMKIHGSVYAEGYALKCLSIGKVISCFDFSCAIFLHRILFGFQAFSYTMHCKFLVEDCYCVSKCTH